jgi:hypothetical protein
MLLWPRVVCGSTMYRLAHLVCVFPSHLGVGDWWPGVLLVSPFNVKQRFSVQAGGVEGSKFCLFLVVLPARCVSSISPRFHFRRHAFCFFPLAAILEFQVPVIVAKDLKRNVMSLMKGSSPDTRMHEFKLNVRNCSSGCYYVKMHLL